MTDRMARFLLAVVVVTLVPAAGVPGRGLDEPIGKARPPRFPHPRRRGRNRPRRSPG